ncbi:hypothetical protein [Roseomonas chloroacetimidivorans]|uniref:hypothetical protein n=1 Tax=Roseomonas chloroacetimidivorans TaxID=1766656 RepID=UPI003C7356F7
MVENPASVPRTVLFLTYANYRYESFAISYILSVLSHVDNSVVEIFVDDVPAFTKRFKLALDAMSELFGGERFRISRVDHALLKGKTLPNSIRFLVTPTSSAEFVYIGDVDIIVLERDILARHLRFMQHTGLPYSNSVRFTDRSRMSGLHFSYFKAYYPVPDVSDLDTQRLNDEMLLRILCERKNYPIQDKVWFRPVHGIHASPNRQPLPSKNAKGRAIPGWDFEAHSWAYRRFRRSAAFRTVAPLFDDTIKDVFRTLDQLFLTLHWKQMNRLSSNGVLKLASFRCAMAFLSMVGRKPFGSPL